MKYNLYTNETHEKFKHKKYVENIQLYSIYESYLKKQSAHTK